jgi:hypothetical protein
LFLGNGGQSQFFRFRQIEEDIFNCVIQFLIEDDLNYFCKWERTLVFYEMKEYINFSYSQLELSLAQLLGPKLEDDLSF